MDYGRWINDTSIKQRYLNEVASPNADYDKQIQDMKAKYAAFTNVFNQFFNAARQLGIIFVTAASNEGFEWDEARDKAKVVVATGDNLPTCLGGPKSEMITVGAATKNGTFAVFTSPQGVHIKGDLIQDPSDRRLWLDGAGNPNMGSIDIWAPGQYIDTCGVGDGVLSKIKGTSPASAVTVRLFVTLSQMKETFFFFGSTNN